MYTFQNEEAHSLLKDVLSRVNDEVGNWNRRHATDAGERETVDVILNGGEEDRVCLLLDKRLKGVVDHLGVVNDLVEGFYSMRDKMMSMLDIGNNGDPEGLFVDGLEIGGECVFIRDFVDSIINLVEGEYSFDVYLKRGVITEDEYVFCHEVIERLGLKKWKASLLGVCCLCKDNEAFHEVADTVLPVVMRLRPPSVVVYDDYYTVDGKKAEGPFSWDNRLQSIIGPLLRNMCVVGKKTVKEVLACRQSLSTDEECLFFVEAYCEYT